MRTVEVRLLGRAVEVRLLSRAVVVGGEGARGHLAADQILENGDVVEAAVAQDVHGLGGDLAVAGHRHDDTRVRHLRSCPTSKTSRTLASSFTDSDSSRSPA